MAVEQMNAGGGDTYLGQVQPVMGGQVIPGQMPSEPVDEFEGFADYFTFDERARYMMPDGKQWIEFKKMTEGDRAKYLKATRSDVRLDQKSGEARIPFDQSAERKALLLNSVTDWLMVTRLGGRVRPVPFQNSGPGGAFGQWIDKANPEILADLEKAIRKFNPWLLNEMTVEQIDKEIENLTELRKVAEERDIREKASGVR